MEEILLQITKSDIEVYAFYVGTFLGTVMVLVHLICTVCGIMMLLIDSITIYEEWKEKKNGRNLKYDNERSN